MIGFPLAYYAARLAPATACGTPLLFAVVLPLWANYLVQVFAWKSMLSPGGLLARIFDKIGVHASVGYTNLVAVWITFSYLWLPYVILPIFAALERVPGVVPRGLLDLGARGQ